MSVKELFETGLIKFGKELTLFLLHIGMFSLTPKAGRGLLAAVLFFVISMDFFRTP